MTLLEMNTRYRISMRKLRWMNKEGVLKCENAPDYWQRAVQNVRDGKLSVRSIALAYKFPDHLEALMTLTPSNRKTLRQHFKAVELPTENLPKESVAIPVCGAANGDARYMAILISQVQALILDRPVTYAYLGTRLLLSCDTAHQINLMYDELAGAFTNLRKEPLMNGWWRKEPDGKGDYLIVYQRPATALDL